MTTYRYPLWMHIMALFGLLVMLGMAFIGWMAFRQEGARFGLYFIPVGLLAAWYWVYVGLATPRAVVFKQQKFTIQYWGRSRTLAYVEIEALRDTRWTLGIVGPQDSIHIPKFDRLHNARVFTELERRVPVSEEARQARLAAPLPINIRNRLAAPLFMFILGLIIVAAFTGSFWYVAFGGDEQGVQDWILSIVMLILATAIGLLFSYFFLWKYIFSYTFTSTQIKVRHLLRTVTHVVEPMTEIEFCTHPTTVRGVPRTRYYLQLHFQSGKTLAISPNELSFPVDYTETEEERRLKELQQRLQRHYLAPVAEALAADVAAPAALKAAAKADMSPEATKVDAAAVTGDVVADGALTVAANVAADNSLQPAAKHPAPAEAKHSMNKDTQSGKTHAAATGPGKNLPPTPIAKVQLQAVIAEMEAAGDKYAYRFEDFRDWIHALGPGVMAHVLAAANSETGAKFIDMWSIVLADAAFPPAMPYFIAWLTHEDENVRFSAAMALDAVAGGRFGIEEMIEGGWVQHHKIQAKVPEIRTWWREGGKQKVPTLAAWQVAQFSKPVYTEQEKRYNFIETNPTWVMQADRVVLQPETGYRLPTDVPGLHVIGGEVWLRGEDEPRPAVFEMDVATRQMRDLFVRESMHWISVVKYLAEARPLYDF